MHLLNLVGLVMGYLGSIMLSVGILRSKQEVIDEERPFWGPNPFKMRSTLNSRLLGFAGMAALVAGFATTTVANAFITILDVDNVWHALIVIVFLVALAYSIIITALRAKKRAHIGAKHRYYFNELIDEARGLRDENIQKDEPGAASYDFDTLKRHYLDHLSQYNDDLSFENKQILGHLVTNIHKAENVAEIKAILDTFVNQEIKHPTQMPK